MSQQCMRAFSTTFKESAVLRLGAGERLAELARELGTAASCSSVRLAGLNRRRGPKPRGSSRLQGPV